MPTAGNNFYLDHGYRGGNWGSFVGQELPDYIREVFGYCDKRENTLIGGLSMGGYGALHTALNYPERFSGCSALSSALRIHALANGKQDGVMPPEMFRAVFGEPDKLLETIRSRVQRIDIKKISNEDIEQALIEKRGISQEDAHRIARLANGNWMKALDELQVGSENELFLDMYIMLMRLAYQRKIKDLRKWSEQMAGMGREKQKRWLTFFLRMTRENFMYNFGDEELVYMTQREEDFAKNFARFVNEKNILPISDLANLAIRDIGQNANGKIVFFDLALQMIVLLLQK
jgi:hypothetical protein